LSSLYLSYAKNSSSLKSLEELLSLFFKVG
jgi:hypothetical protein